ncbi:MAG TPA: DUF4919 domain-containing protein [Rhizomicrobium sp.]|nr:DUF4919 domain-containing protein [Rhizomicrobium sp.]
MLPRDNDEYAKLAAQAAAHDGSVDFHALRFTYLKSAARHRDAGFHDMKEKMLVAAKAGDDAGVRSAAEGLLSINYADVAGQAFLSRACEQLRDRACAAQADFVARGLIKSIMDSGDGKTCKSGWEVASVDEEYFVLNLLDAMPKKQALVMGPPSCDMLDTSDKDGNPETFNFRIDAVLADEADMFKQR